MQSQAKECATHEVQLTHVRILLGSLLMVTTHTHQGPADQCPSVILVRYKVIGSVVERNTIWCFGASAHLRVHLCADAEASNWHSRSSYI